MKVESVNSVRVENTHPCVKKQGHAESKSVVHSLYNSTCPIGANYYSPSFGLNNPQAALERAKGLKALYAQKGINYLLPDEVLTNKKIFQMVERAGRAFDGLLWQNALSKETLNEELKSIIPVADKVFVRDMKDLRKDLETAGCSKKDIECYTNCSGLSIAKPNSVEIYVPLDGFESQYDKTSAKATFMHELKHALTSKCTNINNHAFFVDKDLNQKSLKDEKKHYSQIFMNFERNFNPMVAGEPVTLDIYTVLDEFGYKDKEELYEMFDKAMNAIIKEKIETSKNGANAIDKIVKFGYATRDEIAQLAPDGVLTDEVLQKISKNNSIFFRPLKAIVKASAFSDDAFSSKYFWETMAQKAKDEKEAYKSKIAFRELACDYDQPLDFELPSLIYAEMEKFFRQKAKNATH